jgi:peptidoglycan/LPS O-acetylase OafA/YrhL
MNKLESLSSQSQRLAFIDFLRGFACLWVIGTHAHAGWTNVYLPAGADNILQSAFIWFLGLGGKGVDLFIVISGFCLTYPLIKVTDGSIVFKDLDLKRFLIRRGQRILPVYYTVLMACTLALSFGITFAPFQGMRDVIPYAFLVQNWIPSYHARINGTLWSVAMEAQLYATLPLILLLVKKIPYRVVLSAFVILSAMIGILSKSVLLTTFVNPLSHTAMPVHFGEFVLGIVAAIAVRQGKSIRTAALGAVAIVCTCIGGLGHISKGGAVISGLGYTAWGITFCIVVILLSRVKNEIWDSNPVSKLVSRVGLISYSMYAIHFPIMLVLERYKNVFGTHPLQQLSAFMLIGFPSVLVASLVLFHLVEKRSIPAVRLQK